MEKVLFKKFSLVRSASVHENPGDFAPKAKRFLREFGIIDTRKLQRMQFYV